VVGPGLGLYILGRTNPLTPRTSRLQTITSGLPMLAFSSISMGILARRGR
jgi:hypothetical protein